jgi:transcriptional regulator PpsR
VSVKQFSVVEKSLGAAEAQAAARLVAIATDVAMVVDSQGVIRDFSCESDDLSSAIDGVWVGRRWTEVVTVESRPKIEALLKDAESNIAPRWRHVNHPAKSGPDIPMLYSAVRVGRTDRIMAVGRDLRPMATLQQRLVDAQQSMEREYARLRHAETRYRLLFQISAEAVLVLDAMTGRVTEANPAAATLLGSSSRRLVGRTFFEGFDAESQRSLEMMLAAARASGRSDDVRARMANGSRELQLSATLFREDKASFLLVRAAPVATGDADATPVGVRSRVLDLVEGAPDGFVVTDTDGKVLLANRAFLDMAQVATEQQAREETLDRWLGRPGVDLSVLMANLREHGTVRLFATSIRGNYGSTTDVEICAVSASAGDESCFGFSIRDVSARLPAASRGEHELPRSVQQMTELVGRVPLKDLVREATDMIERLCIEAALELSSDNRASAAEMLGLSRQSLYVKLRRYGLGDLVPPDDLN